MGRKLARATRRRASREILVLQHSPRSHCDAAQGRLRHLDRKTSLIREHPVDIPEKRASPRQGDSAVDHVRCNLGLSLFERRANHLDDLRQRLAQGFDDIGLAERELAWNAPRHVLAPNAAEDVGALAVARADPISILMRSAVLSPMITLCLLRTKAAIASSILSPPTRAEVP